MGITVGGYHIDHIDDDTTLSKLLSELLRRHPMTRHFKIPPIPKWAEALRN